MDMAAEAVMAWDVRELDFDLTGIVELHKIDDTISIGFPLLELPLHHNFLVLLHRLVHSNNVAIEYVVSATGYRIRLGKVAGPLADLPLISHAREDDTRWHAIDDLNFCLLRHLYKN